MSYKIDYRGQLPDGAPGIAGEVLMYGPSDQLLTISVTGTTMSQTWQGSDSPPRTDPVDPRPADVRAWVFNRITELERDGWRVSAVLSRRSAR
ncbi:hypothetical protein [Herbidospora mongoliensis]|uniref:hypothetical protein n=1 Tax=Herbidospora mongoliensis TaxID=688067 RepID=UPI00082DF5B4|nr:hypothetical protein [Herbidospora mongoliensis]